MAIYRTAPGAEGRLFPSQSWDNGWSISIQADKAGYACSPKASLERLEDYDTVEVKIDGPFQHPVDPTTLDMPQAVMDKFLPLDEHSVALGLNLTWEDVEAVKSALMRASMRMNAGIPRGSIGWSSVDVFHGTSEEYADDIEENGVDVTKSSGGYFGWAFYVAEDKELAISNYAEMADEGERPAVVQLTFKEAPRILDLRNERDAAVWSESKLGDLVGDPSLPIKARKLGIDGVYDRSVGGLAIYNPKAFNGCVLVTKLDRKNTPGI